MDYNNDIHGEAEEHGVVVAEVIRPLLINGDWCDI